VIGIIAALKALEGSSQVNQEQKILDRFKTSKGGAKCLKAIGEEGLRRVIRRALKK
jgi:hypothetical protein